MFGGKYHVERVIGVGGVAIVVAARHLDLEETVAIKFLQPEVQNRREVVQRFAREARAAVRIKSEFAARIFDVGYDSGRGPYLVMEYLAGQDLGAVLETRGPFAIKRAVELVMQTCEALAVAHSNDIIHRDIKPENLFLARREDGTEVIKVLDFGISKAALTGSLTGIDDSALKTQELMGTPLYMSPEQIRSTATVDRRADIWSLGVVLYELITGELAFKGDAITNICAAVLESDPTPLSSFVAVPDGLQAVIDRCLQKDPGRRFQDVAELAIALLPFGSSMSRVVAERTSTILRASGKADVKFKFHSAPPPAFDGGEHVVIPTTATVPSPNGEPSAANTLQTGSPSSPPAAAYLTNPEALRMIAVEGRRTRSMVVAVATGLLLAGSFGTAVFYAVRDRAPTAQAEVLRSTLIESDPPGARVELNGNLLGETPLTAMLPVGSQSLRVTKDGYAAETLSVLVAADERAARKTKVTLKHDPVAAAPAPAAAVAVTAASLRGAPAFSPKPAFMVTRAPALPPPSSSAARVAGTASAPASAPVVAPAETAAAPAAVKPLKDGAPAATTHVKVISEKQTNVVVVE